MSGLKTKNSHVFYPSGTSIISIHEISNGNRTGWRSIRSVSIRVIAKLDDRVAGVRFDYHEYDYRSN